MIRRRVARLRVAWTAVPKRERRLLVAAIAAGVAIRLAYVLITSGHGLAGDEIEYDSEGAFIAAGKWWWTTVPYGIPHEGFWKAPLYPAWVGLVYELVGRDPDAVLVLQALLGGVTIGLTWLLGRRLFGPAVALAAAVVVAVYPGAWQYETRLYAEGFAAIITLVVLIAVFERTPTGRRAAGVGVLLGIALLLRPSSILLFAGVAVAWLLACGFRTGLARVALTAAVAMVVISPWTIRTSQLAGGFVPLSMQDAAAYGTFNADAANDRVYRWQWRPLPLRDRDLFDPRHPRSDLAFYRALRRRATDFVRRYPTSVPKAMFWNGIVRTFDLRRPARVFGAVPFEGRTAAVAKVSLYAYWVLAALAAAGLWSVRGRREVVLPVLALLLATTIVFTSDGGTRYRAPLEPVIVIFACIGAQRIARSRLSGPPR